MKMPLKISHCNLIKSKDLVRLCVCARYVSNEYQRSLHCTVSYMYYVQHLACTTFSFINKLSYPTTVLLFIWGGGGF